MPRILLCFAFCVAGLQVAAGQEQVFRAGRTTVVVPVTVLDEHGFIVKGLRQEDFRLYDKGRVQEITNFTQESTPLTIVVLIDTSDSMTTGLDAARHAAEQFVLRLWPADRVRVGSFSDMLTMSPRFTSDRDELLGRIRTDLHIGNPTRLFDAVDNAVTALAPEAGRRVILLLSNGCDTASDPETRRPAERSVACCDPDEKNSGGNAVSIDASSCRLSSACAVID